MQVKDDPELLALMMEDTRYSPELFKPGVYWSNYEKLGYTENNWNPLLPELEKKGLHNFRRRNKSVLTSFGATDLTCELGAKIDLSTSRIFTNSITNKIPKWVKFVSFIQRLLNNILPIKNGSYNVDFFSVGTKEIEQLFYDYARVYGEMVGAKLVDNFDDSLIGNPEHIVEIDNRNYTMRLLSYYLQYVYCYSHVKFEDINVMVELGSGSGKQIEVIKKLHPEITILLFDIPPALYVCEQYLSAVFPESIIKYRETRKMDVIPEDSKGKIFMLGNWKFPILEKQHIDLFWNSASFQEMEPDIVANYLKYINLQAKYVFLRAAMSGSRVSKYIGDHGVKKSIDIENYKAGLSNFAVKDISPTFWPITKRNVYSNSFWERI